MTTDALLVSGVINVEFLLEDLWGDTPYEVIVRGHHAEQLFLDAAQKALDARYNAGQFRPVGSVRYGWARKVPSPEGGWVFWPVGQKVRDGRGVFPYTLVEVEEVEDDD